jgi:hypothetical protein
VRVHRPDAGGRADGLDNAAQDHGGAAAVAADLDDRGEKLFPAIARWVRGYGHIEIGDKEMFGFAARSLDDGGLIFEDDKPDTLAEAMAALEKGLIAYFEREGIEIEGTG